MSQVLSQSIFGYLFTYRCWCFGIVSFLNLYFWKSSFDMHSCAICKVCALVLLDCVYIEVSWDLVQLLLYVGHYSPRLWLVIDVSCSDQNGLREGLLARAISELLDHCKLIFLCACERRVTFRSRLTAWLYESQVLSERQKLFVLVWDQSNQLCLAIKLRVILRTLFCLWRWWIF